MTTLNGRVSAFCIVYHSPATCSRLSAALSPALEGAARFRRRMSKHSPIQSPSRRLGEDNPAFSVVPVSMHVEELILETGHCRIREPATANRDSRRSTSTAANGSTQTPSGWDVAVPCPQMQQGTRASAMVNLRFDLVSPDSQRAARRPSWLAQTLTSLSRAPVTLASLSSPRRLSQVFLFWYNFTFREEPSRHKPFPVDAARDPASTWASSSGPRR